MKDKVVIITGGSNGIGKTTAIAFAELGAKVLITGRRQSALDAVSALHENIQSLQADSGRPDSATAIIDAAINRWGRLDILVNNAGAGATARLDEVTETQISEVFSVNVLGTSLLSQAALPYLRENKGSIINVSSVIGQMPSEKIAHYGASKAAVDFLTKSWALELAPDVRVNAVAPGPTYSGALTGMMGLNAEQAKAVEQLETDATPLGRRGLPEDISTAIVWLADSKTSWITGQVLTVDGGFGL